MKLGEKAGNLTCCSLHHSVVEKHLFSVSMFGIMLGAGLHRETGETQSTLPVHSGQKPRSLVHSPLQTNICPTFYKSGTNWFKMYLIYRFNM